MFLLDKKGRRGGKKREWDMEKGGRRRRRRRIAASSSDFGSCVERREKRKEEEGKGKRLFSLSRRLFSRDCFWLASEKGREEEDRRPDSLPPSSSVQHRGPKSRPPPLQTLSSPPSSSPCGGGAGVCLAKAGGKGRDSRATTEMEPHFGEIENGKGERKKRDFFLPSSSFCLWGYWFGMDEGRGQKALMRAPPPPPTPFPGHSFPLLLFLLFDPLFLLFPCPTPSQPEVYCPKSWARRRERKKASSASSFTSLHSTPN